MKPRLGLRANLRVHDGQTEERVATFFSLRTAAGPSPRIGFGTESRDAQASLPMFLLGSGALETGKFSSFSANEVLPSVFI